MQEVGRFLHPNTLQASVYVTFVTIPLSKASHVIKPTARVRALQSYIAKDVDTGKGENMDFACLQ